MRELVLQILKNGNNINPLNKKLYLSELRVSSYRAVNTLFFGYKIDILTPYREIKAVGSEIHIKHINAL